MRDHTCNINHLLKLNTLSCPSGEEHNGLSLSTWGRSRDALITSDRPEEEHYGSDGIQMNKPAAGRTGYIKMFTGHVVLLIHHG